MEPSYFNSTMLKGLTVMSLFFHFFLLDLLQPGQPIGQPIGSAMFHSPVGLDGICSVGYVLMATIIVVVLLYFVGRHCSHALSIKIKMSSEME